MTRILDLSSLLHRTELPSCEVDGEIVLLDMDGGVYLGMNTVAARIWQILEAPCKAQKICDILAAEYSVDDHNHEDEVLKFLNELVDRNIIQISESAE
jgi:hypothetical protein